MTTSIYDKDGVISVQRLGVVLQDTDRLLWNTASTFRGDSLAIVEKTTLDTGFAQIFLDSPVLGWMISNYFTNADLPLVTGLPRKEIMKMMFGWGSKSGVKTIRKISIDDGSAAEHNALLWFFTSEKHIEYTKHWKEIPVQMIIIWEQFSGLRFNPIIDKWRTRKPSSSHELRIEARDLISQCEDILRMRKNLEITDECNEIDCILRGCTFTSQIHYIHSQLVERINLPGMRWKPLFAFPPSPLSGTEAIIPLSSYDALMSEGRIMSHCIASYEDDIVVRKVSYMFKVLYPERATLEVRRDSVESWDWHINSIKAFKNGAVSSKTVTFVEEWFEERKPRNIYDYLSRSSKTISAYMEGIPRRPYSKGHAPLWSLLFWKNVVNSVSGEWEIMKWILSDRVKFVNEDMP